MNSNYVPMSMEKTIKTANVLNGVNSNSARSSRHSRQHQVCVHPDPCAEEVGLHESQVGRSSPSLSMPRSSPSLGNNSAGGGNSSRALDADGLGREGLIGLPN